MIYTAYTESEYNALPKKYRKKVLGVSEGDCIIQIPLCPECGNEMMEDDGFLSCLQCGASRVKRIIKE